MEQRKLIPQGDGGLTIYVPKKWADRKGLIGGDFIDIDEIEGNLIIGSKKSEKKDYTLNVDETIKPGLSHIMVFLYRLGYDTITINGDATDIANEITSVVSKQLLGFEITKKTAHQIIIESISEPEESKFDTLLRRNFYIIQESLQILIDDIKNGEMENYERILALKEQEDKFASFCKRSIKKEKYTQKIITIWQLLNSLRWINNSIFYIYENLTTRKIKAHSKTVLLIENFKKYFELAMQSYYEKNLEKIVIGVKQKEEHFKLAMEIILGKEFSNEEKLIAIYIRDNIRQVPLVCLNASLENLFG